MKILMTAGGGGHFSPLLSVYEQLPKDVQVLVVGRKYGLEGDNALSFEYQTATRLGMPYVSISTGRWQRKFTKHTIPSLLKLPKGFFEAYRLLRSFSPNVVLSFGGYVTVPVVIVAWLLHIPVVVHEQTMEAGAANKIASYFAKKVCVSWQSSVKFFPKKKTVLTGNPIRKFSTLNPDQIGVNSQLSIPNGLPIVYITGGSLGSHAINVLVEGCIEKLLEKCVVIHQTGGSEEFNDYDRLQSIKNNLSEKLKKRYILTKFVIQDQVGAIMQKADLVVARSGINTVCELLFFGKPSLLIPLPFSQKQEQHKNAQFLAGLGLSEVAAQNKLTPTLMQDLISTMLKKLDNYKSAGAKQAKNYIILDAAKRIIAETYAAQI